MHTALHLIDASIGWIAIAACAWSVVYVTFRG